MSLRNEFTFIGNLGTDPEEKKTVTRNDKTVVRIGLAVQQWGSDQADWFNLTFWEKNAANLCRLCQKGSRILARGYMRWNEFTAQDGARVKLVDFVVESWELLARGRDRGDDRDQGNDQSVYDCNEIPF